MKEKTSAKGKPQRIVFKVFVDKILPKFHHSVPHFSYMTGISAHIAYDLMNGFPKKRQRRIAKLICDLSDELLKMEDFGYETF